MGQIREVDAISNAIIETEREIAGSAWDLEETERDDSGRNLEEMGDGLEGQHEAEDESEAEGEDAEGEEETEGEGDEGEGERRPPLAADTGKDGKAKDGEVIPPARTEPEGRVPSARLREANAARVAAEAERDALKAQIDKAKGDTTSLTEKLDLVMREIADLKRSPRTEKPAEPVAPKAAPDLFENPTGFVDYLQQGFQTELSKRDTQLANMRVETSMAIAHAFHKDTFEEAFAEIQKKDPRNPEDRATVQRIYNSPNPGEALVGWHRRNKALAEVGDDPAVYRERIAKETREALIKDPEFRKQLIADLRGEAAHGDDGRPRTETRLPRSLARASGSNLGAERNDVRGDEDSEQAVANAAWR